MKVPSTHIVSLIVTFLLTIQAQESEDDPDERINHLKAAGAEYLQNVMDKLQQEREEGESVEIMELTKILNMDRVSENAPDYTAAPNYKMKGVITGPTPNPPIQVDIRPITPPAPALTADELKAIYNAALLKGGTLPQLQNANSVTPFVHQGTAQQNAGPAVQPVNQGVVGGNGGAVPGYYYYFYPIKSFLQGQQTSQQLGNTPADLSPPPLAHNGAPTDMTDSGSNKAMEPLFMALTSFIGMALMFIFSVLFMPKFGHIRSGDVPELKETPNELMVIGKLVLESVDGKDCTERIACELGRFVRNMKLDKVVKIMEIVLPPNMSRQIGLIKKAATKKEKCNFIPCRFKTSRPPAKRDPTEENWKKGISPHDLWMKHFEKEKNRLKYPVKQPVWSKKADSSKKTETTKYTKKHDKDISSNKID